MSVCENIRIKDYVSDLEIVRPHLEHPLLPALSSGCGFTGGGLEEGEREDYLVASTVQKLGLHSHKLLPRL